MCGLLSAFAVRQPLSSGTSSTVLSNTNASCPQGSVSSRPPSSSYAAAWSPGGEGALLLRWLEYMTPAYGELHGCRLAFKRAGLTPDEEPWNYTEKHIKVLEQVKRRPPAQSCVTRLMLPQDRLFKKTCCVFSSRSQFPQESP